MSRLTVFLARLIGLFTVLLVAGLMVRGSAMVESAVADAPVMLVYAIISLAAGLAVILGHNVWSGGALPVVVTVVGWLMLAKGLVLLLLTPETVRQLFSGMHYGAHYDLYLLPALAIGLYLTFAGFTAHLSAASPKPNQNLRRHRLKTLRQCKDEERSHDSDQPQYRRVQRHRHERVGLAPVGVAVNEIE
jgi:hypothetical protein